MRFDEAYKEFLRDTGFENTPELRGAMREFAVNTKYLNVIRRNRKYKIDDIRKAKLRERERCAVRCEEKIHDLTKRWRTDITSLWTNVTSDLEHVRKVQHVKRTLKRMIKTYGMESTI